MKQKPSSVNQIQQKIIKQFKKTNSISSDKEIEVEKILKENLKHVRMKELKYPTQKKILYGAWTFTIFCILFTFYCILTVSTQEYSNLEPLIYIDPATIAMTAWITKNYYVNARVDKQKGSLQYDLAMKEAETIGESDEPTPTSSADEGNNVAG